MFFHICINNKTYRQSAFIICMEKRAKQAITVSVCAIFILSILSFYITQISPTGLSFWDWFFGKGEAKKPKANYKKTKLCGCTCEPPYQIERPCPPYPPINGTCSELTCVCKNSQYPWDVYFPNCN